MSFHLITIDQLMQFDQPTLEYDLRLFQKGLDGTIAFMSTEDGARKDENTLDDLSHLLTLRKVFTVRLAELQADAAKQKSELAIAA